MLIFASNTFYEVRIIVICFRLKIKRLAKIEAERLAEEEAKCVAEEAERAEQEASKNDGLVRVMLIVTQG